MNKEVIKNLQIKNGKLQIQIERLKLDKEEYYLDYLDLRQIIDKAVEYMQNHQLVFEKCSKTQINEWFNEFYITMSDILRGENNENNK